ncbi:23S rRNA pseudouridine synthase, RluD family [Campylobacter pinnipediorum subsp. pinnipediorum]|uniref:RluA family pseudouridine synthase n=1 Tax=Campylobacter pinnipediorum TaxID=1965231 RepID=UPI000994B42D|nr:RluA family pseudouridine synthase [Campylobacter pinnipediorum]AQW83757.1 23S rRNA pseudouridine synthase, RluD family [Campylobacter pinnipediorum subsp. pinnipediorum]
MPYINKFLTKATSQKAYEIIIAKGFSMKEAQRLIDKGRLICDQNVIKEKNAILNGDVYLIDYEPNPKGIKPIFECDDFAVFDKPSGVLSHPNGRNCVYSLNDEIWHLYGKNACVAHRLDFETSGLIVVALNKNSQIELKKLFEQRKVKKTYLALAKGFIKNDFSVNAKIGLANNYDDVKMRMEISDNGKDALTGFRVIKYFDDIDATLLEATPFTGRQHQIRVHLFHVQHSILGDPLYGLTKDKIIEILDKKMPEQERLELTGASRLLLHSNSLSFTFNEKEYNIKSNFNAYDEFYKLAYNKAYKK